ncbi:MAG: LysR substrate-binding domain-containing protein [Pseudomonadota bacterium]
MHLKEVDANLLVTLDALLVDASVTRAAERLGRSASAISHALAKLRELFDDELFVRAGQRLVPTARAQELAPTVHVILAGMESLLRPNKPFDPSLTMRAFAAASSEAGELILIEPLRKRLQETAPSVRVDWTPSHADSTIDELRNARCHFVIDIMGESAAAPDMRSTTLFDDAIATLARPGHPFSKRRPTGEAFAGAEHIAVHSLPGFRGLEDGLSSMGLTIERRAEVSSALVGVMATLNSDALLTLPASLASLLERQFDLTRIAQPIDPVSFPVRLLWHTSYDRDECHQWLRGEFSLLAQELAA